MLNELEQNRFDELKAKGPFLSLNKEEREEYSALKAKNDVGAFHAGLVQKAPDTVTISKTQMDGILARLDELEAEKKVLQQAKLPEGEWKNIDTKSEVRTAQLREKEGDYFMGFVKNNEYPKKIVNERTREWEWIYLAKWLKSDGTTVEEPMPLTMFARLERVVVLLKDKEVIEREMTVGTTRVSVPSEADYAKYKTTLGEKVPMKVRDQKISYTIELPDKRTLKVDESILNA